MFYDHISMLSTDLRERCKIIHNYKVDSMTQCYIILGFFSFQLCGQEHHQSFNYAALEAKLQLVILQLQPVKITKHASLNLKFQLDNLGSSP